MSYSVLAFDHVSKHYRLNGEQESLRSAISNLAARAIGRHGRSPVANSDESRGLWALRDINFEVRSGEALGIIGPNGAGKTTILKLLSRVTTPTEGQIRRSGRISALIELGAGFHPELTGRENVYLNGAIMGMSKAEIRDRFDEIVDFAELRDFIDVPVKRYSSGMYARLGFAVAVHTDPDVLLVDEVLSVGDMRFQMKSFERMEDFIRKGKTLILVTHNSNAVVSICSRALLLSKGRAVALGDPWTVLQQYKVIAAGPSNVDSDGGQIQWAQRHSSGEVEIVEVTFFDNLGGQRDRFKRGEAMVIRLRIIAHSRVDRPLFGIAIVRQDGLKCFACMTSDTGFEVESLEGEKSVSIEIDALNLQPSQYRVSAAIMRGGPYAYYDLHDRAYPLTIDGAPVGDGEFCLDHHWSWTTAEEST